ncbi:phage major capsid protein [bacterium]|nr:phage major capsid protein [bacterium]
MSKEVRISRALLQNARINVEQYVQAQIVEQFGYAEEVAFIIGTGVQQPQGLLKETAIPTYPTATTLVIGEADIVNWSQSLPSGWERDATIIANKSFQRKVLGLLGVGAASDFANYVSFNFTAGMPALTIAGYPVITSDAFPTGITASTDAYIQNSLVAVLGNFRRGYVIVDNDMMTVQRLDELYARTNEIGYIARKRTDGW